MASSRSCIPYFLPVWIMEGIWWVFDSLIRFRTAGFAIIISRATQRSLLSILLNRTCAITARIPSARVDRIWACSLAGKTSITRSTVFGALVVCRVAKTRCPVALASTASDMVSRSLISPTRIISGSSRSAPFKAALNVLVWIPTSRWFTIQPLLSWTNSMGSSIVMI